MQSPWGEIAVSDAHAHFFSRRFFDALAAQTKKPAHTVAATLGWNLPAEAPEELAKTWVAELDEHGVSRSVLIASVLDDEDSVIAARDAFPGRFFAYAMVDPMTEGAAVTGGLDAICLFPAMHRYSLHHPNVQSLLDQAVAQHCAVFVHCGVLTVGVRHKLGLPSPFDMRFSNPLDLHAIALRNPTLPFVVPHFGAGSFREALMLADLCPNVYLDTSSSNSWMRYEGLDLPRVFRRALDVVGAGRLLFGSDSSFFPRGWHREIFERQVHALLELGISDSDAHRIFGDNLTRLCSES